MIRETRSTGTSHLQRTVTHRPGSPSIRGDLQYSGREQILRQPQREK